VNDVVVLCIMLVVVVLRWQVYPRDIYPFGLIAWTGNDILNRRLVHDSDSHSWFCTPEPSKTTYTVSPPTII